MSTDTTTDSTTLSICAVCGKEGDSDNMNTCNKCKSVKYCNAACKKKHRTKHKKACERRVAELHEEQLFKDLPSPEECPICLLPMPTTDQTFQSCCGKLICDGCIYAMLKSEGGKDLCAFCRTPPPRSDDDIVKRLKKLMDKGDGEAFNTLGLAFQRGEYGLAQDHQKANELYLKAGELGCSSAYYNLGNSYRLGRGVERVMKKAGYYFELAAMMGSVMARHNLGGNEYEAGNLQKAMKHCMIAAKAGEEDSLNIVKKGFMAGLVTKDEYADTLRSHHERQNEMRSDEREEAEEAAKNRR